MGLFISSGFTLEYVADECTKQAKNYLKIIFQFYPMQSLIVCNWHDF